VRQAGIVSFTAVGDVIRVVDVGVTVLADRGFLVRGGVVGVGTATLVGGPVEPDAAPE
jgi:hypothetical protein